MSTRRALLTALAVVYFSALIGLAFMPISTAARSVWCWPMLAFVPVGALLILLLGPRRWWAAIAFAVLGASWIEAAQSIWMPVDYSQAMDAVWASLGATAGVALTWLALRSAPQPAAPYPAVGPAASPHPREIGQD